MLARAEPWHFGAASGIVMCYAKLGNIPEANRWAREAMPEPGPMVAGAVEGAPLAAAQAAEAEAEAEPMVRRLNRELLATRPSGAQQVTLRQHLDYT